MTFTDWDKIHDIAKELATNQDEASLRSAINRTYYAAFNLSASFAEMYCSYQRTENGKDHRGTIKAMELYIDKDIRKAGGFLSKLLENRRKADYDSAATINKSLVSVSIQFTDKILSALRTAQNP